MRRRFLGLGLLLAFTGAIAGAADPPAKPTVAQLAQWVMTYYQHPAPDEFVVRVRQMVELKTLRGNRPEANEIFLAKLIEANPAKVAGWLDELKDLKPEDAAVVFRAASISQTPEAKQWLEKNGQAELAKKPAPPLIAGGPMAFEPYHLDQLWEWFFATGDDKPVRRVIGFFHLVPSDPSKPGEMPSPPADKNDRIAAANFRVGRPAVLSATSLAIQQDRVFEILKACEAEGKLPPRGQAWLKQAIEIATAERAKRKTP